MTADTEKNALHEQREAEIRSRLDAATPGPWVHRDGSNYKKEDHAGSVWGGGDAGYWLAKIEDDGPRPQADADLIAHAPSDLQFLLDQLDSLREQVAASRAATLNEAADLVDEMRHDECDDLRQVRDRLRRAASSPRASSTPSLTRGPQT